MHIYELTICDQNGQFLSGYNVSVVADGNGYAMRPTEVVHQPFVFELSDFDGNSTLYLRGPSSREQSDISNWSTAVRITRRSGGTIKFVLPDCDKLECAPCSSKKTGFGETLLTPHTLKTPEAVESSEVHKDGSAVVSGPTTLVCVDMNIKVVDPSGKAVTDYIGDLYHFGFGNRLAELHEVGAGKTLHIRNANHTVSSSVWRAGKKSQTVQTIRFNPDKGLTVLHKIQGKVQPQSPARAVIVAPSKIFHSTHDGQPGGNKDNKFVPHSHKSYEDRRHDASWAASVWRENARYASQEILSQYPEAKFVTLLALWNSRVGQFVLQEDSSKDYLWVLRKIDSSGVLQNALEQEEDVQKLVVSWLL